MITYNIKNYRIPILITLLTVVLALGGDVISQILRYELSLSESGEVWRMLTAHFIHLDWIHLVLNLSGLWMIWWIVGSNLKEHQWVLLILMISVAVSTGLILWSPSVIWYVGLSGILYGMLITGLIMGMKNLYSMNLFMVLLVIIKITLEQTDINVSLLNISNSIVVTDAHLYGTVVGLLCGIILYINENFYLTSSKID